MHEGRTRSREFTTASVKAAAGAWVGFVVGPNAMIAATNGVFLTVLPQALGTSRTALSTALAMSTWLVALMLPFVGRAMDRFGVRRIAIPGAVLLSLCFLAESRMQTIWHFFAIQAILSLAAAMHSSVGYAKTIASWFDRNRGFVLGICVSLGAGISQTSMPKLSQYAIGAYGWRGAFLHIGLAILIVGVPLLLLLLRTPATTLHDEKTPSCATPPADPLEGMSRREALRDPMFYLVFFAIMFASMSLLGTLQQAVPMLLERGLAIGQATTIAAIAFGGVIFGEFCAGFLVDRINTPRILVPFFAAALCGILIVHSAHDMKVLVVGAVLLGMGLGGEIGQNAYLVSRYFGLRNFGAIYGLTFAASNIGIGIGILLMGFVRDQAGSYDPMRYIFGATMATALLCVIALRPFRFAPRPRHG